MTRENIGGQENNLNTNGRLSRRRVIQKGAGVLVGVLGLDLLAACGEFPKPKTEAEGKVNTTIQAFLDLGKTSGITTDAALTLTEAVVRGTDKGTIVKKNNEVSAHNIDGFTNLDDKQVASLAVIADAHGIAPSEALQASKDIYNAINKDLVDGFGGTVFNEDYTNLAINTYALSFGAKGGKDTVISILKHLNDYQKLDTDASPIISKQPSLLALAVMLDNNTGSAKHVVENAKNAAAKEDGSSDTAAVLALAATFPNSDIDKVIKTYEKFDSGNSKSVALALTLASTVDGYNANRIQEMYNFANSYSNGWVGLTSDQAASLTLTTAAHEGQLPPLLQDAQIDLSGIIIPIIAYWWFFGR